MDCAKDAQTKSSSKLNDLKFDNKALRSLPIDREEGNYVRTVHNAIYSLVKPTPVKNPKIVAVSSSALELIDLNENDVDDEFILTFSGNKILPQSTCYSQCYAGHQFGSFVGQLGDGAVIYLGEIINSKNQRYELQLKGAGLTPFSRGADGRKVLRSSIREFLCSEAMFHLKIPTTRSATCITSDDYVIRDIYYDGNPISERCTVISRIAETFIRFGTFEIFKTRDRLTGRFGPSVGNTNILEQLFDYVIETFFPEINKLKLNNEDQESKDDNQKEINAKLRNLKCKVFFKEVVNRTAETCGLWQSYGFCHGVLNTDNMSILGLTLDYGPFGFLENFNQFFICNGSDDNGRYSFINQPSICRWNLFKLAEMLTHFVPLEELLNIQEEFFNSKFQQVYLSKMRSKFGIFNELKENLKENVPSDEKLIDTFLETLEATGSDLTNAFRCLNLIKNINDEQLLNKQISSYIDLMINENSLSFEEFKKESKELFKNMEIQYCLTLMEENPGNFKALEKTSYKVRAFLSFINRYEKTKNLSKEQKNSWDQERWKEFFKIYLQRIKFDLKDKTLNDETLESRIELMNANNAKFILRNHLVQRAIEQAEVGNMDEINRIIKLLERPFYELVDDKSIANLKSYYSLSKVRCQTITCSS